MSRKQRKVSQLNLIWKKKKRKTQVRILTNEGGVEGELTQLKVCFLKNDRTANRFAKPRLKKREWQVLKWETD